MDITVDLERLMQAYELEPFESEPVIQQATKTIRSYCMRMLTGKKIAIRGAGRFAQQLLGTFGDLLEVIGLYDLGTPHTTLTVNNRVYKVYPIDELTRQPFDYVLNGVLLAADEVKEELHAQGWVSQYLDLSVMLSGTPYAALGNLLTSKYEQTQYAQAIVLWDLYQQEDSPDAYWNMIRWLLTNRDLCTTLQLLEETARLPTQTQSKAASLRRELTELLARMQAAIHQRGEQYRDCLVFLYDGMGRNRVEQMEWLLSMSKQGMFFPNVFSVADYTRDSFRGLFGGLLGIDDADQPFMRDQFGKILAAHEVEDQWITGIPHVLFVDQPKQQVSVQPLEALCCARIYWELYRSLLEAGKRRRWILVHLFSETHSPYMSPLLELRKLSLGQRMTKSLQYLDRQSSFAHNILGDGFLSIHLCDHGAPQNPVTGQVPFPYGDDKSHIFFLLHGRGVPTQVVPQVTSSCGFMKLIDGALSGAFSSLSHTVPSGVAPIQLRDHYSQEMVDFELQNWTVLQSIAYRATRRLNDLFVCNALGQEFYYRLPDEQTNYIDDPRYQEEIAFLREKTGKHFIDIDADDHYIHSRKLYKAIEEKYGLKKIY